MKTKLFTLLALFLLCVAPAFAAAQEDTIKTVLTEKTQVHRKIFDIPVYVVLPQGRHFIKTPGGAAENSARITLEGSVLAIPFSALRLEFSEEKLKERGLDLKSKSEFLWNGTPAMLLKMFQHLDGDHVKGQWVLLVDRKDHTWMIGGAYDAKDQDRSAEVLQILQTAWWDEEGALQPFSGAMIANGAIATEGTPFRAAGLSQGALVYSKDGKMPTDSEDGALFVLSRINNTYTPLEKQNEFAKEKCSSISLGSDLEIISEREVRVDRMPGREIVARTEDEQDALVYQMVLFAPGTCHVLVGIAYDNHDENLGYFRKLAESYQLKLAM